MDFLFDGGDCCLPQIIPHYYWNTANAFPNNELEEKIGPTRCVAADEKDVTGDVTIKVRPTIIGTLFQSLESFERPVVLRNFRYCIIQKLCKINF